MKEIKIEKGCAKMPHLLAHPKGILYAMNPNGQEIIVNLLTGNKDEQPLVGYWISTKMFLDSTKQAVQLLAQLGYQMNE